MLQGLARIGSTALLIAEFIVALVLILVLSLMAIPGHVRKRKR